MRKIIQYMMMALIAVVLASCANDISEESTPTVKSNIRFVVDDFPMFEKPSTRTIGEEDKGKTAWAVGDEICIKLESKELGIQTATLKYNGVKFEIQDGNSLCYLEGEPVTAYAYYAPGRKYLNDGYLGYKDDGEDGIAEFIEATCNVHYGDDNYIDISFANVTRNYSRLRIATMPNKPITVSISKYTPAGSSNMIWDQNYALTSDEKGNAYLYGTFDRYAEVTVKYREATLATHTFLQATEKAKSYALDATVISANSAEEIKSAIEQKVADGKTTIRLNLAPNAGTDEFMAIREAIKGAAPNDEGTIELTIIGVETIPEEAFKRMSQLKSVKMPDVKEIKTYAFSKCQYLTVVEAPSLNKLNSGAFNECYLLSKLTFGPINYADARYWPIFEDITPNIDLILSDYQKEMIETDSYLYTANNDIDYAFSPEHVSKNFLGHEFKSITCSRYRVE